MDLGLKDKVVVCMSSASGFGKGIATEFAHEGAKVVVCTSEAFKAELNQAVVDIAHYICGTVERISHKNVLPPHPCGNS